MTGTTRSDTTRREGAPGAGAAGAPGSEPDEDAGLMLAFARGEAAAFDRLFERWAAKLLRFLERMVHDTAGQGRRGAVSPRVETLAVPS